MLTTAYNPFLVLLSMLTATLASYVALDLAGRVTLASGKPRRYWILASALAMGIGIWSMHFVGMLALVVNVPVAYDVRLLALSIMIAIGGSAVTFFMSARPQLHTRELLVASLFMGPAIAGMHYTGMAAMRMHAGISYDKTLVVLSVVVAVVVSFVALQLAMRLRDDDSSRGRWLKLGSAAIMGLAVYGMHYTAMLAARFHESPAADHASPGATTGWSVLGNDILAAAVLISTFLVLAIAAVGSIADRQIRARELEADRLRRTTDLLRAVIENSPEAIVVTDLALRVTRWNLAATRLFGWDAGEMIGKSLTAVFPAGERDGHAASLSSPSMLAGEARKMEQTYVRKDGSSVEVTVALSLLRDAHEEPSSFVFLIADETERKRLEAQVRQSQKMEAVGQLAGGIAHDFNNLLTAITSYAQFLHADLPDGDPRRADVLEIQKAADSAASLTRQLLAFSRQQRIDLELLDATAIVDGMGDIIRRLIPANIEVVTIPSEDDLLIVADKGQVEQVLLNLVVNARDAMPDGGVLRIDTRLTHVDSIDHSAGFTATPGDYVELAVTDTGSGMTPEVQARMFEPFFTTKSETSGTGLGLSTVYGIVTQAGGFLSARSAVGKGTAIRALFPLARGDVEAPRVATSTATRGGAETILLVEDQDLVRDVARRVLERDGYTVLDAATGSEALALYAKPGTRVDLVLTDIVMPGMSGYDLRARLRERDATMPILFMSGYSREAIDPAHDTSDEEFLAKPFTPLALSAKVREVLDA